MTMAPSGERPLEKGHWYGRDGSPVYDVPNKSKPGELRPATITDARKLQLVPGVTSILNVLSKPQLVRWKLEQAVLAALTYPRPGNITDIQFVEAILDDSNRQSLDAMDKGTKIHAAIQGAYEGILWTPEYEPYVMATMEAIRKEFGSMKWIAEKPFAHNLGYGGKVDLHSENGFFLGDFKTTSANGDKLKKAGYNDHCMQLAAYKDGLVLTNAICFNVYISTTIPGEVFIKSWKEEDVQISFDKFKLLLQYWQIDKKYNSAWESL